MRAHGNEGRLGRRFLLAAGLIIAVVVPSAAFGGTARFYRECGDAHRGGCDQNASMDGRAREREKNKRVKAVSFSQFRVNCPTSGPTQSDDVHDGIWTNPSPAMFSEPR